MTHSPFLDNKVAVGCNLSFIHRFAGKVFKSATGFHTQFCWKCHFETFHTQFCWKRLIEAFKDLRIIQAYQACLRSFFKEGTGCLACQW